MLQLVSRRILFIVIVCLTIALFIHLGMRMIRNSEVREPNYDLVSQTKLAWEDTRGYLREALQGDFGSIRVGPQTVPVSEMLKESYVNSMGLLREQVFTVSGEVPGDNREYTLIVRSRLDINRLPAALRPLAFFSPSWRLSSDWTRWQVKTQ